MADIVVTIPQHRLAEVSKEEEQIRRWLAAGEHPVYWWSLPSKPRRLTEISRCYFVWDGAILAWHKILGVEEDERGVRVILDPVIHAIPPVAMKGFRGFRYLEERP